MIFFQIFWVKQKHMQSTKHGKSEFPFHRNGKIETFQSDGFHEYFG